MSQESSANPRRVATERVVQLLGHWSNGDGPLYRQLASRLVACIDEGTLKTDEQLPPERALANALSVSRGTIVRAYDQLADTGAVTRVQGSGTRINGAVLRPTSAASFVGERLWMREGAAIDLLKAIPAILPEVTQLITDLDLDRHHADLNEAEPLGWWSVRERVAAIHTEQGLSTSPHQILVTSGAQQAIALVASAMVRSGDVVLGEAMTWPGLIDGIQHSDARFEPVALDDSGIVIDDLEAKVDRYRPALIVLNPQHQNPTGTRLPADRVAAVASIAARHRIPVLEDRVAADLGFDRRHLPAIDEYDTGGHGLIAGSICKVAWSGVRLGWLRADAQVINRLRSHKAVADMFTPPLSQALGLSILERYDQFVDLRLAQLQPAADLITGTINTDLSDWAVAPIRGGLSAWVTLPANTSAQSFVQHANRHGVLIASGREFAGTEHDGPNIRIPFTAPLGMLTEGLARLRHAWGTFDHQPTSAPII